MKYRVEVDIRALEQMALAVVARAAAGEIVTITDRGRPVALMKPIPTSRLQELIEADLVSAATKDFEDLPNPIEGPIMSDVLTEMREKNAAELMNRQ